MKNSTEKTIRMINKWFIQWADDMASRDSYSVECASRAVEIATELRNLLTALSSELDFEYDGLICDLINDLDNDVIAGHKNAIKILLK